MKKLTAALSAAAIAVTMAVPFTASAATIINEDFSLTDGQYTNNYSWTINGGGTNNTIIQNNITDAGVGIHTATDNKLYKLIKKLDVSGAYTLSFKLKTAATTPSNVYIMLTGDNKGSCQYQLSPTTKNDSYSGKFANSTITRSDNDKTIYFKLGEIYNVTIDVDADGTCTAATTGTFTAGTVTANTISGSFGKDYTKTTELMIQNTGEDPIYIDDIKIETVDPVKASTKTEKVDAEWSNESVVIDGVTITGGTITCGDQNVQFYRTDITAGDTDVKGGTISANGTEPVSFTTTVGANKTGSFYTAVTYTGELPAIQWTVTCNE